MLGDIYLWFTAKVCTGISYVLDFLHLLFVIISDR